FTFFLSLTMASNSSSTSASGSVPITSSLSSIYSSSSSAIARYSSLRSEFVRQYSAAPSFFVRAPGRVNLIGEHIDYSGYSVLPIAIERDTVIAGCINQNPKEEFKHAVYVSNNKPDQYSSRDYPST